MLIYISPPISHYVHTRAYFIQLREEMWPVGADTKRNHQIKDNVGGPSSFLWSLFEFGKY